MNKLFTKIAAILSATMAVGVGVAAVSSKAKEVSPAKAGIDTGYTAATMTAGTNGSSCIVNSNAGIKVGTSSKGGNLTITVPSGATDLRVYAAAWKGVSGLSLNITKTSGAANATISPAKIALTADNGITSNSPFTLSGSESSFMFDFTLTNITQETVFTFATSIAKRFVLWSAQTKSGGDTPTSGVTLSVNPTSLELETGDTDTFEVSISAEGEYGTEFIVESSDDSVASVSPDTGDGNTEITVTAEGEGEATITVTSVDDENTTATVAVTVSEPEAVITGTFDQFSGTLVEGDYVVCSGTTAMKNVTTSAPRIDVASPTISDSAITDPVESIVWHIAPDGDYWTFYNAAVNKYVAFNSSNGQATLIDSVTDYARFSVSDSYDFLNKQKNTRYLRYNNGYGFASYTTSTGSALTLYKKAVPTKTVTFTVNNSDYGSVSESSISVPTGSTISANGASLTIGSTTVTATPTTSTAQYTYAFSSWSTSSGTVSDNMTITATFTQTLNKYTVTYHKNTTDSVDNLPAAVPNVNYGTSYTLSTATPAPTRSGYTFDGWSTISGDNNSAGKTSSVTVNSDVTVYAIWVSTATYYDVSWSGTHDNLSFTSSTVTHIPEGTESVSIYIEAPQYYKVPTSITVSGAGIEGTDWEYSVQNNGTGLLYILVMPSNNVTIQASADPAVISLIEVTVDDSEKSFYLGDDFTHATASVSGMYDDAQGTLVDVTSGCTWSTPDMRTVGSNKTVTVTHTASGETDTYEISVSTKSVTPASWSKVTASKADWSGTYVIVSNVHMMGTAIVSNRVENATLPTIANDQITDTVTDSMKWTVAKSGDYYTIQNVDTGEYLSSNGTKNQAALKETADSYSTWSISYSDGFVITNIYNDGQSINQYLRNNGDYGWACYGATQGGADGYPQLYEYIPGSSRTLKWITAEVKSGTYYQTDTMIASNFTVTAYYDNGDHPVVTSNITLTNAYLSNIGANTVTVSYQDSVTKSVDVIVTAVAKPVDPVVAMQYGGNDVTNGSASVYADNGDMLVTVTDQNFEGTVTYTWSSSSASAIAVKSGGNTASCTFEVKAAGSSRLSCRVVGSTKGDVTVYCDVTVSAVHVTEVTWSAPTIDVFSGATLTSSDTSSWNVKYSTDSGKTDQTPESFNVKLGGATISLPHTWVASDHGETLCVEVGGVSSSTTTVAVTQTLNPGIMKQGEGSSLTSDLTFTAACGGSGTADDGKAWIVTSDGAESTFDPQNGKGIHYGTSGAAVQYIKLTSTAFTTGKITKVEVNASTASGVTATVGVKIGGVQFGGEPQSLTSSAVPDNPYTFTGNVDADTIEVEITKPSSATKAIYCKSVVVTYTTPGELVDIANNEAHKADQRKAVELANEFNRLVSVHGLCSINNPQGGTNEGWTAINTFYTTWKSGASDWAKDLITYASEQYTETDTNNDCIERMRQTYAILVGRGYNAIMSDIITIGSPRIVQPLSLISNSGSEIAITVVVSMIGLSAVGGYFFLRKRKEI